MNAESPRASPSVIAISASTWENVSANAVFSKYIDLVYETGNCVPIFIPAIEADERLIDTAISKILSITDGVLLTGGLTNVLPRDGPLENDKYGGPYDPARDAVIMPLVQRCIDIGMPLLGICRGMQEINSARNGNSAFISALSPSTSIDHNQTTTEISEQYKPSHTVAICAGGLLTDLVSQHKIRHPITINSCHLQAIETLGNDLHIEATASDGVIEALSFGYPSQFCLGVQWHPEWTWRTTSIDKAIVSSFMAACSQFRLASGI